MRLIATLLVRDEIDIVAATIEHHLAAGVDHIIATDNGSVDGTADVLRGYQREGVLDLRHIADHDYRQTEWVTPMARVAAVELGADWVINIDADEFLWPLDSDSGRSARFSDGGGTPTSELSFDLRDCLALIPNECGFVFVRRDNLLADPELRGPWPERLVWRDTMSLSERGTRIDPKSVHRSDPQVVVGQGNHVVQGPAIGPGFESEPLLILHAPDRGYAQFARKVENGGASCLANVDYPEEWGWHWRADFERLRSGTLRSVWETRQLTPDRLAAERRRHTIRWFPSLRDRLERLVENAVCPAALRAVLDGTRVS